MAEKDYYKILGVNKNASEDEIKSAYRKLAKQYHPDLYAGKSASEKKEAENKFKEISHAYDVLGDPTQKAKYDQYGSEDGPQGGNFWGKQGGFQASGGFEDIFSNIFSSFSGGFRQQRSDNGYIDGEDIFLRLTITFKEAAFGCTKEIPISKIDTCSECHGNGAKNPNDVKTCSKCGGKGIMMQILNTPFGQMSTTKTCDACNGRGKIVSNPCKTCSGTGKVRVTKNLNVSIPAGIDNGQKLNYQGQGNVGSNGGQNGSVVLEINVKPHKLFVRKNSDLFIDVPITMTQAALGCKIFIPTLEAPVSFTIPEGTQTGQQFKLKGYGIKQLRRETKGDLFVKVIVEIPKNLSSSEKNALRDLESSLGQNQYPIYKEYLKNVKEI